MQGVVEWRCNNPPPSENIIFFVTEHQINPGRVCKFEFARCGPVENTRALYLSLPQNFTTNQGLHSKFPRPTSRTACQCPYAKEMR